METLIKNKVQIYPKDFDFLGNTILNESTLQINSIPYRVIEIEFYLHNDEHQDKYAHQNAEQLNYGCWYFHKHKNGTPKGGTRKGLDFTLGNEKCYFGILIRGIKRIDTGEIIEGPCLTVNRILSEYKVENIVDLKYSEDNKLEFKDAKLQKEDIYKGPRVGIDTKDKIKYPDYATKDYRYLIYKNKIKKLKKNLKLIEF